MGRATSYIVFLSAFAAYVLTASPLVTAGDSGELVAASCTLGIPHPPGYPVYALLGRTFSLLPAGDAAFRMNLMSGVFTALCALTLYLISLAAADGRHSPAAAFLSLAWAFTGIPWSQAVYAEVYPLQAFLSLTAVLAMLKAVRGPDFRYVLIASFLLGLSVTGHYAGLLFTPALVFYALWSMPGGWNFRKLSTSILLFLAGLTPFLYVAVRAAQTPPVNWGSPDNYERFFAHLARASYGDVEAVASAQQPGVMLLAAALSLAVLLAISITYARKRGVAREKVVAVFAASAGVLFAAYLVSRGASRDKLSYIGALFWREGLAAFLPFLAAGLWAAFRKDKGLFVLFALLIVVTGGVSAYRVPSPGEFNFQPLVDKFFLPFTTLTAALSAFGAKVSLDAVFKGGRGVKAAYSLAVLPAALLAFNFSDMDNSGNFSAHDYAEGIMRTLPPRALFLVSGDNHVFLTSYMVNVERMRPDVEAFSPRRTEFRPQEEAYRAMSDRTRPVYSSQDTLSGMTLEPAGLLNRFPSPYDASPVEVWAFYDVRVDEDRIETMDWGTRQLLAEYYFAWARDLMMKGRGREEIFSRLDAAAEAGRGLVWANMGVGRVYLSYGEPEKARELFERALAVTRGNPEVYVGLGGYYLARGMYVEAEAQAAAALSINGVFKDAHRLMAEAKEARGDVAGAVEAWGRYIELSEGPERASAMGRLGRLKAPSGGTENNR